MALNDLRIPTQVVDAIRVHIEKAVRRSESGYPSAQEAEDTVTGALGENLRTPEEQFVNVSDTQAPGTWSWRIGYSKFGSGGGDSTESVVGADGILEVEVGSAEYNQRKSSLFQAKNSLRKDPRLVAQCAKLSLWREAAFVISYSAKGYQAYSIDDVLLARGALTQAQNAVPLVRWIVDVFMACLNGHLDLYYDKNQRRLYWIREKTSKNDTYNDRRIWVDFRPKHLINIHVSPPDWRWHTAKEIIPEKISLSRLEFKSADLFGERPFSLTGLRKRRAVLLRAYHSDNSYHLDPTLRAQLDARIVEINNAYSELIALVKPEDTKTENTPKQGSPSGLGGPTFDPLADMKQKVREKVRVRRKRRSST